MDFRVQDNLKICIFYGISHDYILYLEPIHHAQCLLHVVVYYRCAISWAIKSDGPWAAVRRGQNSQGRGVNLLPFNEAFRCALRLPARVVYRPGVMAADRKSPDIN